MASVSISKDGNKGRRRIQFVVPKIGESKPKRQTWWIGKATRSEASEIAGHIRQLIECSERSKEIPDITAVWVENQPPKRKAHLVRLGLVKVADPVADVTLGSFLPMYRERKKDIKPASLLAIDQAIRNLNDYFGVGRRLHSVTAGDADDFRVWLTTAARDQRQKKKKDPGLSGPTVAKRLQRATAIFADALRRELITRNPFEAVKRPRGTNPGRQKYIPVEWVQKLIEQAPSAEWRLLLALSRYMGVRVPSEPFSMTWQDIDLAGGRMRIPSPKTETIGKSFRTVPILPTIRQCLEDVESLAEPGAVYVFEKLRERASTKRAEKGFWADVNLRQELLRMIRRAGLEPWPKLWHNLRGSAQTDIAAVHPLHVACEWLGNTRIVAQNHYLTVTDRDFENAIGNTPSKMTLNPTHSDKETKSIGVTRGNTDAGSDAQVVNYQVNQQKRVAAIGFEPMTSRL